MTKEEILHDIADVEKKFEQLKSEKQQAVLNGITKRLKSTADQLQHDQRSAVYVQFKEAEAYIMEQKADVESSGQIATDPAGNQAAVKWIDNATARTFGSFKAGQTITIAGYSYIVTDFAHSYAGSTLDLLALSSKALIDGEPTTPYSGRPCAFDYGAKTLILANSSRLAAGQTVIISGTKYVPRHIIGSQSYFVKYALEAVV